MNTTAQNGALRICVTLNPKDVATLDAAAQRADRSRSAWVRRAIREAIRAEAPPVEGVAS